MTQETIYLHRGFSIPALLAVAAVLLLGGTAFFMSSGSSDDIQVTGSNGDQRAQETNNELDSMTVEHVAVSGVDEAMKAEEQTMESGAHVSDSVAGSATKKTAEEEPLPAAQTASSDESLIAGTFESYSEDKLALAANGDVVLFFHASWCPSCRALEADIEKNISDIPDGVHLLKVDYDAQTVLKKKYGVVRQHTLVQVDETGEKIKTFTGLSNTLAQVTSQVQ